MVAVRNFLSLSSSLTYLQLVLFQVTCSFFFPPFYFLFWQFLFLLKLLEKDMSLSENCSTVLIHIVRRLTSQEVNKYGSPNLPDQRSIELRDATPKKKKQCHCKNSRCLKFITCYMQQNLEKWGSVCSCNGVRTSAIEFYKRVPWVFSHAPCPSV
nr:uncharacterized protein LOC113717963 isoform X1 [Coffea arabica]